MENIGQLLPLSIHTTCGLWFCSSARGSAVGYMPTHHIPDTVCLARVQLNGAAPRSRPTLPLQMALFSDTLFIVSAVGGDGNHCCGRCRVFLGFVFFFFYCTQRPSAAAGTCGPSRPPSAPAHIFWEVKPGFPRFHCRCLLNAHSHPLI